MKYKPLFYHAGAWVMFILTAYAASRSVVYALAGCLPAIIASIVIWKVQKAFGQLQLQQVAGTASLQAQIGYLQSVVQAGLWQNALLYIRKMAYPVSDSVTAFTDELLEYHQWLLHQPDKAKIELEQEIAHLKSYISIYRQCTAPVVADFKAEGDLTGRQIPPALLLPFVESAFEQGIGNDAQRPVRIRLKVTGTYMVFTISCKTAQRPDDAWLKQVQHRLNVDYRTSSEILVAANGQTYKVTLNMHL